MTESSNNARRLVKRHVKHASTTGTNQTSLVKAVIGNDQGRWVRPEAGGKFYIDESPKFPLITFEIETNSPPPYQWKWRISWDARVSGIRESAKRGRKIKTFSEAGSFTSNDKTWDANLGGKVLGGRLTVEVVAGAEKFRRTVSVLGRNPSKRMILDFVNTLPQITGFDLIIEKESHFKNFINADNEPITSGDGGYGLTQMTNPAPSYEQIWSWKENIKVGVKLFHQKRQDAIKIFKGQIYTEDQLERETFARWNGGTYHEWNKRTKKQERKRVLCDPSQSNIGWNMENSGNSGKSARELHERDKKQYHLMKDGQNNEHRWMYTGICYVDRAFED